MSSVCPINAFIRQFLKQGIGSIWIYVRNEYKFGMEGVLQTSCCTNPLQMASHAQGQTGWRAASPFCMHVHFAILHVVYHLGHSSPAVVMKLSSTLSHIIINLSLRWLHLDIDESPQYLCNKMPKTIISCDFIWRKINLIMIFLHEGFHSTELLNS